MAASTFFTLKVVSYFVIFIIGFPSNLLLLYKLLTRSAELRKSTYSFVLSLTCGGTAILLTLPLQVTYELSQGWITGEFSCKLVEYLEHCGLAVTSLTHLLISFDRYLAVVRVQMGSLSRRVAVLLICLSWCLPGVVFTADFYLYGVVDARGKSVCTSMHDTEAIAIVIRVFKIVLFAIPFLVTGILNISILHVIWFKWQRNIAVQGRALQAKKRLSKLTLALSLLFILGCSPKFFISQLKSLYNQAFSTPYQIAVLTMLLYSAITPCVILTWNKNISPCRACCVVRCNSSTPEERPPNDMVPKNDKDLSPVQSVPKPREVFLVLEIPCKTI